MLADNVINFAQDRQMREWTFNYYMNNAVDCLLRVSMQWNDVKKVLNAKRTGIKGKPLPRRRWDRQHAALEFAITEFEESLQ